MRQSENIIIEQANPEHAKGISGLYCKVYDGNYSLPEFLDPTIIETNTKDKNYVWYVAKKKDNGIIVGSAVAHINEWNNSAELGKTAIDQTLHNKGIAKRLCEKIRDEALAKGADVLWASLRNDIIRKISRNDGLEIVGYLPGMHLVAQREMHLLGMRLTENSKAKRIVSPRKKIYEYRAVKEIMHNLDIDNSNAIEEKYPSDFIIGTPPGEQFNVQGYYYSTDRSLVLSSCTEKYIPEYIQATVLADKTIGMQTLEKMGFIMTGFLPAWFEKHGKRYDCVNMALPIVEPVIDDKAFIPIIDQIQKGFRN